MSFIVLMLFLGITFGLAIFIIKLDRGAKEPVTGLLAAFGFGLLAILVAGELNNLLLPVPIDELIAGSYFRPSLIALLVSGLMIGVIEETAKALPLTIFIYKKKYFNEHTDGVIYFGLSGLCFSLVENIFYLIQFGSGVGFVRLLTLPFFHAALTGIFGYYLSRYKLSELSKKGLMLAFAAIVAIHGIYDFILFTGEAYLLIIALMMTAGVSLSFFIFYKKATVLDQAQGLSAVGNNKFCRSCGQQNIAKTLYCEKCGRMA